MEFPFRRRRFLTSARTGVTPSSSPSITENKASSNNSNGDNNNNPILKSQNPNVLPMLSLPPTARNNLVATLGEFVGTFLFLLFAFAGTQVANTSPTTTTNPGFDANGTPGTDTATGSAPTPDILRILFISLCFGGSLTANVWAFYRVTGGLFNPSVGFFFSFVLFSIPSLSLPPHPVFRFFLPFLVFVYLFSLLALFHGLRGNVPVEDD